MDIIIGIPNAGKTTYSKRYNSVLHYDDISSLKKEQRNEIYRTTDVECIEGIYNTRKSRLNLLKQIKSEHNTLIWLDTPTDECLERERKYRLRCDHLVLSHARHFEIPTLAEGWDEIILIRPNEVRKIKRA